MTTLRYCPFNNCPCRTDCALFQHEGCALANGAGSLYGIMQLNNTIMQLLKMVVMPEALPPAEETEEGGTE